MRRISSHHKALRHLIAESLTVETIAEPIHSVNRAEDTANAMQIMKEKHFDVLGIVSTDGKVVGYVKEDEMHEGKCEDCLKTFSVDEIVSFHTPLKDCLPLVCDKQRLFVLGRGGIDGIVTIADLQKQPIRLMLFGVISFLEMALLAQIRQLYPNDMWKRLLSPGRLAQAESLHDERRKKNQEIDLVACLQLCDKARVLTETDQDLAMLGFPNKESARAFFKGLQELRDNLAHAQDPTKSMGWPEIIKLIGEAECVTENVLKPVERQGPEDAS